MEVWSQAIEANDTVGIQYTVAIAVNVGSVVDFAIAPGANDLADDTKFTAAITATIPGNGAATKLADPQILRLASGSSESWRYCTYDYTTGHFVDDPSNIGPATINIRLPCNHWIGVFPYSYDTGKWEGAIWYLKVDW